MPALFEWELTSESWTDEHPHSEYNFVIEGQLFVESGGVTVEAHAGDVVQVPAGAVGRYWAPKYRSRRIARSATAEVRNFCDARGEANRARIWRTTGSMSYLSGDSVRTLTTFGAIVGIRTISPVTLILADDGS